MKPQSLKIALKENSHTLESITRFYQILLFLFSNLIPLFTFFSQPFPSFKNGRRVAFSDKKYRWLRFKYSYGIL